MRTSWTTQPSCFKAAVLHAGFAAMVWQAAAQPPEALSRFEFTEPQMGVPFRIVLYAHDREVATRAAQAAFKRIDQLNQIMSDYETDSELNELCRSAGQGQAVGVSEDLWKVLEAAQSLAQQSHGAFDITVGPAVTLWRRARRTQHLPEPERLATALAGVGYEKLQLDSRNRTARLRVPGMKLDLGGIAKGYAIDEALKALSAHGIRQALVSGGGDMATSDPPPGQKGWRIEITPLDVPEAPPKKFALLKQAALATSGDVFQRLELDGRRYSHIVDPRTGIGLTDHSLVTIIASNCMTADSLATAVSVLGPVQGLALVENIGSADAHIARKPNSTIEVIESSGFRKWLEAAD